MEAGCLLLRSQKPAACFCWDTVQSTPRPSKTISRMSVLISFNLPLGLRSVLPPSPQIPRKKRLYPTLSYPYLPHALSASLYVMIFFRRIVFTRSSNPQPGGPPLVGCPRLLIEYIRSYPPSCRPFRYPQPEDAPYRTDRATIDICLSAAVFTYCLIKNPIRE